MSPGSRGRMAVLAVALLAAVLAAVPATDARAADADRKRIGFLTEARDCAGMGAQLSKNLAAPLAARGFVERRNVEFVVRCIPLDQRLADTYARELAAEQVDVLVTWGTTKARALQRASSTIPIFVGVGDPVGGGFARTLAEPGGNVTGLSYAINERLQKSFELLRETLPGLDHVILLYGKSYGGEAELTAPLVALAKSAGITTQLQLVGSPEDLARALRPPAARRRVAALAFNLFDVDMRTVADHALRAGIPLMSNAASGVEAGALLSYELSYPNEPERTALILEKLLRGAPPSRIPFELPTLSRLVVNQRTAAAMKIALPPSLLLRADRVIE